MKKVIVIYNPIAGYRKIKDNKKIIKTTLEKTGYQIEWIITQPVKKQDLTCLLKNKCELIVVVGGDGTMRETVSFLIKNKIKTPLAIIACGTANILAQSLGIPIISTAKAIKFAVSKKPQPADAMLINRQRIGMVATGIGYDSVFIKGATRNLKRKFGFLAYVISFLKTFFFYRSHIFKITVDKKRYYSLAKMVAVFNALSFGYKGVGKHISPQDGLLNISVINPKSFFDIFINGYTILFKGKSILHKKSLNLTGKKIAIKTKRNKHIQIDGEVFKGKNLQVEVLPKALNIIYEKKFN